MSDNIKRILIANRKYAKDDVKRLREHPLTPPDVRVAGFIYDTETGFLTEVSCD